MKHLSKSRLQCPQMELLSSWSAGVAACIAYLTILLAGATTVSVVSAGFASDAAEAQGRGSYGSFGQRSRGRDYPRPGRGHGGRRGGGIGVGIGIGIGSAIIMQGLEAEERGRRRRYREEYRDRPRIACRGGRVRGGNCICSRGRAAKRVGRNAFSCERRVVEPSGPKLCKIGRTSRVPCECPDGTSRRRVKRKGYTCVRIAKPVPSKPTPPPAVQPARNTPAVPPMPPMRQAGGTPAIPPIAAGQTIPEFVADEVLITVPNGEPQAFEDAIAQTYSLTVLDRQPVALIGERLVRLRIPPTNNVQAIVVALQGDARVSAAQPNYLYHAQQGSGTSLGDSLQYALVKVKAERALSLANGKGVRIAVIDTGVDKSHPDLKGVVSKSFDATGEQTFVPDDHGTSVAGIISGRGLVRGIAPQSEIFSVRAFAPGTSGGPRLATSYILLRGIDWSVAENARVLNLSFAGPRDPLMQKAVKAAAGKNALMVAAAGNGGSKAAPAYPAAYEEVIAVTATDTTDKLYEKANRGTYIAIASPGVDILAPTTKGGHGMQSGTSFAAAHISGVLALMIEREPNLTEARARDVLAATARDLGPPGRDALFGAGEVNAYEALARVKPMATGNAAP
ncbi:MAG: hypothetical protein RLZ98_2143 [Pseudomonadota bacterium]|jgi:subtilisin family serine protease